MDHVRYFAEFGAAMVALIALPFLVMVVLRSRKIPECFSCGAMKVRPSRVVGFWDTFGIAFQLHPYRCEGCRERFYGLRMFGERKPATVPSVQPQRIVKVAFRFRYGLPSRVAIRIIDVQTKPEPISGNPAILQI
jgi:hypothetical protein